MTNTRKKFRRKSRCYSPIPTKSPSNIKREENTKELLEFLEKLKGKGCYIFNL